MANAVAFAKKYPNAVHGRNDTYGRGCTCYDCKEAYRVRKIAETLTEVAMDTTDLSWMNEGRCWQENLGPKLFYSFHKKDVKLAKAHCHQCPVESRCLEYALATRQDGVWGGTDDGDRDSIRRYRARLRKSQKSSSMA